VERTTRGVHREAKKKQERGGVHEEMKKNQERGGEWTVKRL
jgi:hypothetical protein